VRTPVIHFSPDRHRGHRAGGARIAKGDAVVMLYEVANRDETVFLRS